MKSGFSGLFGGRKAIIGMVHVKALPGTPLYDEKKGFPYIVEAALKDAEALYSAGVDGIQIENQWDRPFLREHEMGPEVVSCLTYIATIIKQHVPTPLGIQVHINGCSQAIAIAKATGCRWIRAFEMANAYISNSGYIESVGPQLLRYRRTIDADDVMVFGDFHVKHGSHSITADRSLEEEAHDVESFLCDAAIITGVATGTPPDAEACRRVKSHLSIPLLVGSGVSVKNLDDLWPAVDGAIVGSSFKHNGDLSNPIDPSLVKEFVDKAREIEEKRRSL